MIIKNLKVAVLLLSTLCILLMGTFAVQAVDYGVSMGSAGADAQWYYDDITQTVTVVGSGEAFDADEWYTATAKLHSMSESVKHIVVMKGIETIGQRAFQEMRAVETISLPDGLVTIEEGAFLGCCSLNSINIPRRVESIGSGAFYNCGDATVSVDSESIYYKTVNGALYNTTMTELLHYPHSNTAESFTVPDSVNVIHPGAFMGNITLKSITFPADMDEIGFEAFRYCSELRTVNMPSSLGVLGEASFGSTLITRVHIPNGVSNVKAFAQCGELKTVTMADTVTTIEWGAFEDCYSLESIEFSQGLKEIESYAFSRCSSLTKVDFPVHLQQIGDHAFGGCTSLAQVNFNDNVHTIGNEAFSSCESIYEITLPASLKTISRGLLSGTNVTQLTIPKATSNVAALTYGVGDDYGDNKIISYDVDSANIYFKAVDGVIYNNATTILEVYPKKKSSDSFVVPEGVTHIAENAFYETDFLKTITLPQSLKVIGEGAFEAADLLETVNMGSNVYDIGAYAFSETPIKSIVIPDSVTTIKEKTFYECKSLANVKFGSGLVRIEEKAFFSCELITEIDLPSDLTTIGAKAFCGIGITTLKLPYALVTMGEAAFASCHNLESVDMNNKLADMGVQAFSHCTSLQTVDFGADLTVIKEYAFYRCELLKTLEFKENLTRIEKNAFWCCYGLEKVDLGGQTNIQYIGESAFCDSEKLEELHLGKTLKIIDQGAFNTENVIDNIDYEGSKEDWANVLIYPNNNGITGAEGDFSNIKFNDVDYFVPDILPYVSGTYYDELDRIYRGYTVTYSDNYFSSSSYNYNHDLARASLKMSMAAYAAEKTSSQYVCVKQLMSNLNFQDIEYNDWYTQEPEPNSIGAIAGMKRIAYDDGDYTLVALAVRGGGYKSEWAGNFYVGDGTDHEGFRIASRQVLDFLVEYITEKNIKGNIKIWMTGYSRAGATVNLSAARLVDEPTYLGYNVSFGADDLYAYCFETPQGVKNPDNASERYNNIFSIVNQNDLVPMVAMRNWDFGRYGVTKYLPNDVTTNEKRYAVLESTVRENYKLISGNEYIIDDYLLVEYPMGTNAFLNGICDGFADKIGSTTNYVRDYQEAVESIGELYGVYGNEYFVSLKEGILDNLTELKMWVETVSRIYISHKISQVTPEVVSKLCTESVGEILYSQVKGAVIDALEETVVPSTGKPPKLESEMVDSFVKTILEIGLNEAWLFLSYFENVFQAHDPLVCMAWLDNMNEDDFAPEIYREVVINGPVSIKVYNGQNELVADVEGLKAKNIPGSSLRAYAMTNIIYAEDHLDGYQIGLALPVDGEYSIIFETGDVETANVRYSVKERNYVTGEIERLVAYNEEVSGNSIFEAFVGKMEPGSEAVYSFSSFTDDFTPETATGTIQKVDVNVSVEGNGGTNNVKESYCGDYLTLYATPNENETFEGWYASEENQGEIDTFALDSQSGETLLSTEPIYTFRVEDAVTIKAKFSENTCNVYVFDIDKEAIVATYPVLKGGTLDIPALEDKEWSSFDSYWMFNMATGEYVPVSSDTKYYEDTWVDAKFISHFDYEYVSDYEVEITGYSGDRTDLEIPEMIDGCLVAGISDNAVFDEAIESISIPSSVTYISLDVLYSMPNLEHIDIDSENMFYSSEDGVLFSAERDILIFYPQGKTDEFYEVPYNTQFIENVSSSYLKKIAFYQDIIEIYPDAFDCENLEAVYYEFEEERFDEIVIGDGNEEILNAYKYYHYTGSPISAYIIENPYTDGTMDVVINIDYAIGNCKAMVAVYTADGKLIGISQKDISPEDSQVTVTVEDGGNDFTGCDMKLFFWGDMSSFKPLCDTECTIVDTIVSN